MTASPHGSGDFGGLHLDLAEVLLGESGTRVECESKHESLAHGSAFEMRMPDDLQAVAVETGARIRESFPWWLRPFLMRGVVAITLGRRIYLSASIAERHVEPLLRHELVHVRQIARLGLIRFYWRYAAEYVSLRRRGFSSAEAYRNISFEAEALAAEKTL